MNEPCANRNKAPPNEPCAEHWRSEQCCNRTSGHREAVVSFRAGKRSLQHSVYVFLDRLIDRSGGYGGNAAALSIIEELRFHGTGYKCHHLMYHISASFHSYSRNDTTHSNVEWRKLDPQIIAHAIDCGLG